MAIMHQYNEPNRDFRHSGVWIEAVKISIFYLKGVLGLSGNRSSLKIASDLRVWQSIDSTFLCMKFVLFTQDSTFSWNELV